MLPLKAALRTVIGRASGEILTVHLHQRLS